MKIAYYLSLDVAKHSGIINKIIHQVDFWKSQGIEISIYCLTNIKNQNKEIEEKYPEINFFYSENLVLDKLKDLLGLKSIYSIIFKEVQVFNPNLIYLRYDFHFPIFLSKYKKDVKIVCEINTDLENEASLRLKENFKGFLLYIFYRLNNIIFLKYTDAICGVTNEITKRYTKKINRTITIPNSINTYKYLGYNRITDKITYNLVFLGSANMPWHGIDIIEEIADLLPEFNFHIIGGRKGASKNIIYYDYLSFEEYKEIVLKSDAAFGTMGLFRNKMEEACPLKVREYLAFRIPIIISYKDTAFENIGYPNWVLKLPNSKNEILKEIGNVKKFILSSKKIKIEFDEILPFVDVKRIEGQRVDFFYNLFN